MYSRVAVVEAPVSVLTNNEPFEAENVGAPEPDVIKQPATVISDTTGFVPDGFAMLILN
jgi:hypothetical protein